MACNYLFIYITIFCVGLSQTFACPILCSCNHKTVDCSGQGKSNLPVGIPPDTEVLHLENNQITSLSGINQLKQLQELHLSGNQIQTLPEGTFHGLINLRIIDLSSNQIHEVSSRAFKEVIAHSSCSGEGCFVNLKNNPIRNIRKYAFYWTSGFCILIAGTKNVLNIESHAFYGNGVIPKFYVSDIRNLDMGDSLFTDFQNISKIEFVSSNISKLLGYTFKGVQNVNSVQFIGSILHDVHSKAFSGMHFVKNGSGLGHTFEPVGVIRFENCEINTLPEEAFADTNIENVLIEETTIHEVQPFVFRGASSLKIIRIQKCFIPNISIGVFSYLNDVKEILLLENEALDRDRKVLEIGSNAFAESMHVNIIRIGQSPSTTLHIKNNAFNDFSQIQTIDLGHFKKIQMDNHALRGLVDVKTLKIHNTEIPILQTHSFSGLTRINNLHMKNVQVRSLQSAEALIPVAGETGITKVLMEGVHLPCDCTVVRTFRRAQSLFTNNNITCLYNNTQINQNFVVQSQDVCNPVPPQDGAPSLTPGFFLCFAITTMFVIL